VLNKLFYSALMLLGVVMLSFVIVLTTMWVSDAGFEEAGTEEAVLVEEEEVEGEVYKATSEASSSGHVGAVSAAVVFEEGEMVRVELTEYDTRGRPKDEDYYYDAWQEAMEKLPGRFVEAGSAEVESVSGATVTSEKAMDAVEKALARYDGYAEPFDGTFMGTSVINDGWGLAFVTLEDGVIQKVQLEEVDAEGELKDEDYIYEDWLPARSEMEQWFVEADSHEVDVYTGATESSEQWMEAVEDALRRARRL